MPEKAPSAARLDALSDGVIAVIATIMVLDLKIPHQEGLAGVRSLAPGILVYFISYAFTGIYWMAHKHLTARLENAGNWTNYANLFFLFCLSLLPLGTSYMIEHGVKPEPVAVYAALLSIMGLAFLGLRTAVLRELCANGAIEQKDSKVFGKHLISLVLLLSAVPLAFVNVRIAMVIITLVPLAWLVPEMTISAKRKDASIEQ